MTASLSSRSAVSFLLLLGFVTTGEARAAQDGRNLDIVQRALGLELRSAQNTQHPMRYRLRKASPRLSTTKEIVETKDGAVARLIAINDQSLSAYDEQKEQARLDGLLSDPGRQRHRKQTEVEDTGRVLKVMRALPSAFIYTYAGSGVSPAGKVEKFSFRPNPAFDPTDLETEALTEMQGELWIDASDGRVARLEGHLQHDVNFGWGMLGRLDKGGWIVIEQSDVGDHQWRIVHFQMVMNGRVLFSSKSFDTVEDATSFTAVPLEQGYVQAIQTLRSDK